MSVDDVVRQPQVDGRFVMGSLVYLDEFVLGAGEADSESFDFAEPAFAFGLGDAGLQVVADLYQPWPLGRVGPEHGTANTCMFMDAWGGECAGAGADGYLASFEVAEELAPFLLGGDTVFVAGS